MSKRLDRVKDWIAIASECEFRMQKMAKTFGVSERTLRRFFQERFGVSAKEWRDARRLEIAFRSLVRGDQVKAAAGKLKFKHPENFAAFIKRQTGRPPSDYRGRK
jgi:AraC-like DNA-binding protein